MFSLIQLIKFSVSSWKKKTSMATIFHSFPRYRFGLCLCIRQTFRNIKKKNDEETKYGQNLDLNRITRSKNELILSMWPNLDLTDDHYARYSHHTKKKSKSTKTNCLTLMLYNEPKVGLLLYSLQLFKTREKLVKSHLGFYYQVIEGLEDFVLQKLFKTDMTKTERNLFLILLGLERKSIKKNTKYLSFLELCRKCWKYAGHH